MKNQKRTFAVVVTLAVVAAACGSDDGSSSEPTAGSGAGSPAAVAISLTTTGGRVGGPLPVTVTLTNGSDAPVTLVRPTTIPNFVSFTVLDTAQDRMPLFGPHGRLMPLGDDGFVELAPGESTSEVLDLGPRYRLQAGTYSVTAEYLNAAAGTHGGARAVTFEPGEGPVATAIELEVAP